MTASVSRGGAEGSKPDPFRLLAQSAPIGVIEADADGNFTFVNPRWRDITGYTGPTPIPFADVERTLHPDDRERVATLAVQAALDLEEFSIEGRVVRPDGSVRRVWMKSAPVVDDRDEVVGFVGTIMDVTDVIEVNEALARSERRYRGLTEALPVGVYHADAQGRIQYVNPKWSQVTGLTEEEVMGRGVSHLIHEEDRPAVFASYDESLRRSEPYHAQYRIVRPDGLVRWVSTHGAAITDGSGGTLAGFVGSIEDITPLVDDQEEKARLAGIVESTSDLVGVVDIDSRRVVYANQAARTLLGFDEEQVRTVRIDQLFSEEAAAVWAEEVAPALERGETWSGVLPLRTADGRQIQVWQSLAGTYRPDGSLAQVAALGRDVTERRRAEQHLAHQATHDALTDLPNRVLLLDHVELALARARRDARLVGLLFLDLDRFKQVNDSLGHQAGDQLLVAVAGRIGDVLRPSDTVARLGGDEFVVLCEDIEDEHHAVAIAQRVITAIEGAPFTLKGVSVSVTASVGIALSSGSEDAHPEALLRDADAAMYRAKDHGRARLELFDESMRQRAATRLQLADDLAHGIEHGHIEVHYQPAIDLVSGRVVNVEALARWAHPERGMLAPIEFISVAEETGLIVGLGLRVLSDACAQARQWLDELGEAAPRVHVNLSARQLTTANLPLLVRGVLEGEGLPPERLCLEITESVLMEDASSAIETLRRLKEIGVSLGIDDFGTGYSSLSYLRRFPVDVLKVDRSFIDGLGPDPEDSAIVAAIVNLAHTLELEAVAEGVETESQLQRLRQLGCAAGQGYLFARPVPAARLGELLRRTFEVGAMAG